MGQIKRLVKKLLNCKNAKPLDIFRRLSKDNFLLQSSLLPLVKIYLLFLIEHQQETEKTDAAPDYVGPFLLTLSQLPKQRLGEFGAAEEDIARVYFQCYKLFHDQPYDLTLCDASDKKTALHYLFDIGNKFLLGLYTANCTTESLIKMLCDGYILPIDYALRPSASHEFMRTSIPGIEIARIIIRIYGEKIAASNLDILARCFNKLKLNYRTVVERQQEEVENLMRELYGFLGDLDDFPRILREAKLKRHTLRVHLKALRAFPRIAVYAQLNQSPLHQCVDKIMKGEADIETLDEIELTQANVNELNNQGLSILPCTLCYQNFELARILLNKAPTLFGDEALSLAIFILAEMGTLADDQEQEQKRLELISDIFSKIKIFTMYNAGIIIDQTNGNSCMHNAAMHDDVKFFEIAIRYFLAEMVLTTTNLTGKTACITALYYKSWKVIQFFITQKNHLGQGFLPRKFAELITLVNISVREGKNELIDLLLVQTDWSLKYEEILPQLEKFPESVLHRSITEDKSALLLEILGALEKQQSKIKSNNKAILSRLLDTCETKLEDELRWQDAKVVTEQGKRLFSMFVRLASLTDSVSEKVTQFIVAYKMGRQAFRENHEVLSDIFLEKTRTALYARIEPKLGKKDSDPEKRYARNEIVFRRIVPGFFGWKSSGHKITYQEEERTVSSKGVAFFQKYQEATKARQKSSRPSASVPMGKADFPPNPTLDHGL